MWQTEINCKESTRGHWRHERRPWYNRDEWPKIRLGSRQEGILQDRESWINRKSLRDLCRVEELSGLCVCFKHSFGCCVDFG